MDLTLLAHLRVCCWLWWEWLLCHSVDNFEKYPWTKDDTQTYSNCYMFSHLTWLLYQRGWMYGSHSLHLPPLMNSCSLSILSWFSCLMWSISFYSLMSESPAWNFCHDHFWVHIILRLLILTLWWSLALTLVIFLWAKAKLLDLELLIYWFAPWDSYFQGMSLGSDVLLLACSLNTFLHCWHSNIKSRLTKFHLNHIMPPQSCFVA